MLNFLEKFQILQKNVKYNITLLDYNIYNKKVLNSKAKILRREKNITRHKNITQFKTKLRPGLSVFHKSLNVNKRLNLNNLEQLKLFLESLLFKFYCCIVRLCKSSVYYILNNRTKTFIGRVSGNFPVYRERFCTCVCNLKNINTKFKKIFISCAAVLIIIIATGFATVSYEISIDGKVVGLTRKIKTVQEKIDQIRKKSAQQYDARVIIPSKVKFKKLMFCFAGTLSEKEISEILDANLSVRVYAYAINVNGMDIAYVKDKKSAEKVLDKLKEPYMKDGNNVANIGFLEDVKIVERETMAINLENADQVYKRLTEGSQGVKKYVIQAGDTISEIAEHFNIKVDEIKKANPGLDIDHIQIGEEINLTVPRYAINVTENKIAIFEQKIPFEVKYENTNTLYKGQERIKVSGIEGKKIVKAEQILVNGIVEKTVILQEEVLKNPKTQIVLRGTKERPRTVAYGVFMRPSAGSVTSRYGMRWGRMHTGVDLGASYGSPIKAADGGKVIFAGWEGAYGKLVKIDHENGYVTYYGHCSKIYVKAGERVARGEVIAAVGSTGRVTGPHLHFEVRKNGKPVNPLRYIK